MGLNSKGGKRDDVNNKVYKTRRFTINNGDPEVEAFTDAATKESRQWIRVVNEGPGRIAAGPAGEPKQTLVRNQEKVWNHGGKLEIFVEVVVGASADILVEESG